MHETTVSSAITLTGALSHLLRAFCAQQWGPRRWGQLSCSSGSKWPPSCSRRPCFGRGVGLDDPQRSLPAPTILWFCDSQHRKTWHGGSWGASLDPLCEEGVFERWSPGAVVWGILVHGSICRSHALREQQPASNTHFYSCVAVPRHDGNGTRLFFCWKKHGWMGSDSFVRKVWKLVTESKRGVVWGDEQGTGYKPVVIPFCTLCSAYLSN